MSPPDRRRVWLVSACLLGERCRYDGAPAKDDARAKLTLLEGEEVVPVCPEVLGGLPTPRTPAQIVGGEGGDVLDGEARVVDEEGRDVTEAFLTGAARALEIAQRHGATHACLKAKSPTCGHGQIHAPSGLVPGNGVAAARLERAGLRVLSEDELASSGLPVARDVEEHDPVISLGDEVR